MSAVSWKKPLILSATLLLTGTLAIWLEYSHKPKQEARSEEDKKLFKLKDKNISQIKIYNGAKSLTFKCAETDLSKCKSGDNPKWELLDPIKSKADESNVNSFVSSIAQLSQTELIDLALETNDKKQQLLKDYKLDGAQKATKRVEVFVQTGPVQILYLGELHPVGDSLFVSTNSSDTNVYLIPTFIQSQLDHQLTHWRDKKIMSLVASTIKSFDYNTMGSKTHFEKKDGQWEIFPQGKKTSLAGDIESIDNFLTTVGYLNAKEFEAEHKTDPQGIKALSGSKLLAEFKIQTDSTAEPVVFKTFEKTKNKISMIYATLSNSDPVYLLEESSKAKLIKKPDDLRLTKLITTAERFSIKTIGFENKSFGKLSITNDQAASKWLIAGTKTEATNEKVQALLDKLSGNRVKSFLTTDKTQASDSVSITIGDDKIPIKRHLTIWKDKDKVFAVDHLSKRKETLEIDAAIWDVLPKSATHFNTTQNTAPVAAPAATKPGVLPQIQKAITLPSGKK